MLKFAKKIEKVFDKFTVNDDSPIAIKNIKSLFDSLKNANFLHEDHKPWFYFMLTGELLQTLDDFFTNVKTKHGISIKSSRSLGNSNSSLWKKVTDPDLKNIFDALKKLKANILDETKLTKDENAPKKLIEFADTYAKEANLPNYLHSKDDRIIDLFNLISREHLQPAFDYLLRQRGNEQSPLILDENIAVRNYMLAMLTELNVASVNWQSDQIQQVTTNTRNGPIQQVIPGSFAARVLQACIFQSRKAAKNRTDLKPAEHFVSKARDLTVELYLGQFSKRPLLTEIFNHPEQLTITKFANLDREHSDDLPKLVQETLALVKLLVIEPFDRVQREEDDYDWFFERHVRIIHKKIEWLNANINRTNADNILILAKCVLEFNGILYLLHQNNRCQHQPYATDRYSTDCLGVHTETRSEKARLYKAILTYNLKVIDQKVLDAIEKRINAIEQIATTKRHFLAIQKHIECTCYFAGDYTKLNKYAYLFRTKGTDAGALIRQAIIDDISKGRTPFFQRLLLETDAGNLNLSEALITAIKNFLSNIGNAQFKQALRENAETLVGVVIDIITHPRLQHNFPQEYYAGTVDPNKTYANRLENFPSAATNFRGPQNADDVLINRTTTGEYLAHGPKNIAEITKIFLAAHNGPPLAEEFVVLALGFQKSIDDRMDLLEYPAEEFSFEENGQSYRLIPSNNNVERSYELRQGETKLCTFTVYNLETPDNSSLILDELTERKLLHIYHQPHKIIHCHSTVGRSLTHQLAISGVNLIDNLRGIENLDGFLTNLQDINSPVYETQFASIQRLMSIFNVVLHQNNADSRLKCSMIATNLRGFLAAMAILFNHPENFEQTQIEKISAIFIDLLTGLRQMQFAIQESNQMLSAIGLVCSYFARTALNATEEQIEHFKRAIIQEPEVSFFAKGFDVPESRLVNTAPILPMAKKAMKNDPFAAKAISTAPKAIPKAPSKKVPEITTETLYSKIPPANMPAPIQQPAKNIAPAGNYIKVQQLLLPRTESEAGHYIALPQTTPQTEPAANAVLQVDQQANQYTKFPSLPKLINPGNLNHAVLIPKAPAKTAVVPETGVQTKTNGPN